MPTSDYLAELLSLNPTGYYKFDEDRGTTLFDFTQYARNLVISGAPTLKVPSLCSDWPNGAMKFNSGGDSCGNTFGPSPFASLGAITIIGLLRANTIAQTGTIAESTGSGGMDWALLQQNNLLRYACYVGGSVNTVDSASALTAATRLPFALTRASRWQNGLFMSVATALLQRRAGRAADQAACGPAAGRRAENRAGQRTGRD